MNIRTCAGEKLMMSFAELAANPLVVNEHAHPHEQVGLMLEGKVIFTIGGEDKTLQPGDSIEFRGTCFTKW